MATVMDYTCDTFDLVRLAYLNTHGIVFTEPDDIKEGFLEAFDYLKEA